MMIINKISFNYDMLLAVYSFLACALYVMSAEIRIGNSSSGIVFIIMSQPNAYHETIAERKRMHIRSQLLSLNTENANVYIAPKDFPNMQGYWTMLPIIEKFSKFHNFSWLFFMEENTNINVPQLVSILLKYDMKMDKFIGHALRDTQPTIIHHFDDPPGSVTFPHLSAGMAMTVSLVKRAAQKWSKTEEFSFSIDAKYEFAKFLFRDCGGIRLIHEPGLCIMEKIHTECASWIDTVFPTCDDDIFKENVFFAVKTCQTYHQNRVTIVKKTWAMDTNRLVYFSDVVDPSVPTQTLGVENVSRGHCRKTLAIIKYFRENFLPSEKWLVIADDDTLVSVPRLLHLLSCYNSSDTIALGERYGYYAMAENGYNYITGGGGMVFSLPTVKQLAFGCNCPSDDSPDDMIIGMCLKRLGIAITHLPYFHQARPDDYSKDFLKSYVPVSFHKHWNIDPVQVYKMYLQTSKDIHNEL